jgi:hypothetical protein
VIKLLRKIVISCVLLTSVIAANGVLAAQCETNFTSTGSFFAGKTMKTFAIVEPDQATAFKGVYKALVSSGWTVTQSDKELGVITATETVSYGNGKTVPLNVVVDKADNGGTKVSLTFTMSGGLAASADSIKSGFCKLIAGAGPDKAP